MELGLTMAGTLLAFIVLDVTSYCLADKLSPGQKAPAFAKGSGGSALKAPYQVGGSLAADVGQRRANPAPPAAASSSGSPTKVDGVVREETVEYKEVDGQLIRVVEGNFGYDSPEGLPIAVKYVADENGNRASFTFGTAVGSGALSSGGAKKPGLTPGGPGATSLGGGNGGGNGGAKNGRPPGAGGPGSGNGGASTYLPPTTKVDRSYLPPN